MNSISTEDLNHILKHINDELEILSNKTIILTGATGFFGKWILSTLLHLNRSNSTKIRVLAISRNPDIFLDKYPQFIDSAITFYKSDLKKINLDIKADFIIHAGMDVKQTLHNKDRETVNNEKAVMENILSLYESSGCSKILFTSSGAYYDKKFQDELRPIETDKPKHYSNDYGKAKSISEDALTQSTVNYSIARCFAFLGPYLPLDGSFAAGNFINDVLNNRDIEINGTGKPIRSFLYMSDLMIYLLKMLTTKENIILNIGSSEEVSILELAQKISRLNSNTNITLRKTHPEDRVTCYSPSTKKLEQVFNHTRNHISLDEAINKTFTFYKKRES